MRRTDAIPYNPRPRLRAGKGLHEGEAGRRVGAIDEMISEVRNEIKMISRSVADAVASARGGIENRSARKRSRAVPTTTTTRGDIHFDRVRTTMFDRSALSSDSALIMRCSDDSSTTHLSVGAVVCEVGSHSETSHLFRKSPLGNRLPTYEFRRAQDHRRSESAVHLSKR